MKILTAALAASAGLFVAGAAFAEPYVDYTPTKGATDVTTIHVDPNHLDDYLTGLSKDWVKGQEMAKRHGLIDWYAVYTRLDSTTREGNVTLVVHYPNLANLEPDKARDMAMMQEGRAIVSKDKEAEITAGYDKYRTFVSEVMWVAVDFPK